jgi:hypothetical protein
MAVNAGIVFKSAIKYSQKASNISSSERICPKWRGLLIKWAANGLKRRALEAGDGFAGLSSRRKKDVPKPTRARGARV